MPFRYHKVTSLTADAKGVWRGPDVGSGRLSEESLLLQTEPIKQGRPIRIYAIQNKIQLKQFLGPNSNVTDG